MDQDRQRLPLAFSMCDLGQVPSLFWVSVSILRWSLKPTLRSSCSFQSVLGPYLPLKEILSSEDILNRHSPSSVFPFHNACPPPPPRFRLCGKEGHLGAKISPPPSMAHPRQPQAIIGWGLLKPGTRGGSGDPHSGCSLC